MKLGSKNIEWILVAVLIVSTLAAFLLLSAAMMEPAPQATTTNLFLILIFGGEMLVGIILLRIYDKISSILSALEEKKQ